MTLQRKLKTTYIYILYMYVYSSSTHVCALYICIYVTRLHTTYRVITQVLMESRFGRLFIDDTHNYSKWICVDDTRSRVYSTINCLWQTNRAQMFERNRSSSWSWPSIQLDNMLPVPSEKTRCLHVHLLASEWDTGRVGFWLLVSPAPYSKQRKNMCMSSPLSSTVLTSDSHQLSCRCTRTHTPFLSPRSL